MTHPINILIIGSGGREHALAWKISQSPFCKKLYICSGNAGTSDCGENLFIPSHDFAALAKFIREHDISMLVVGPEDALVAGIADYFGREIPTLNVVGPGSSGARLEGSKEFSKQFMLRHGIPSAAYRAFTIDTVLPGLEYISQHDLPVVLKADGLAAGKGVVVCNSREEAKEIFIDMIVKKQFGQASAKVVVEQYLDGIEVSVFVLTDGKDYQIIGHAKDYKRVGEGDIGPNTGGMGCITPVPFVDDSFMKKVTETIIKPTIDGLLKENISYKGFIFFGLMNVSGKPYVIEYNCRMGDPETEVVLPRLKNDLVVLLNSLFEKNLSQQEITYIEQAVATIVAVSKGYPGTYRKGYEISLPFDTGESIIFHAGTIKNEGKILTNGGRVLAITSTGDNIRQAVAKSRECLNKIHFEDMYYRQDIGYEF
jgi:phosphoribosylamine--glycine ligase